MDFNSLDDAMAYIRSQNAKAMNVVGKEMEDIMKEEVRSQVYNAYSPQEYDRTGDVEKCARVTETSATSVVAEFADEGGWTSVKGGHYNAYEGLEDGWTWGRGETNLMETSESRIESEIPNEYKGTMNSLGVPVK